MTTTQVVATLVNDNNNGLIQDYVHPDDHIYPTHEVTPGLKPFTVMSTSLTTNSFQGPVVHSWVKITQGYRQIRIQI